MADLVRYILPFALFAAFLPFVKRDLRKRGEAGGSFRDDVITSIGVVAAVVVSYTVLDAVGASESVQYIAPFVLALAIFFMREHATRS